MCLSDAYQRRWQPFVRRFLTVAGRLVYVYDLARLCTLFPWPYLKLRALAGAFDGAKVNLGAGPSRLPGWVHADLNPLRRPDVWIDVRNRWPFRTASIAGIATSHLLEHLFDSELSYVLKEAYRVLRPGGFFRVSVPDLDKAIADYLAENPEGDQELEKRAEKFQELCHYYGGHHQVFNFARLRKLLLNRGFVDVKRLPFPQSDFLAEREVIEVDLHPQESLFVECRKPGGSTAKDSSSR